MTRLALLLVIVAVAAVIVFVAGMRWLMERMIGWWES